MSSYPADTPRGDVPHVVYRFYDHAGDLLYVGITDNPRVRWNHHRRTKTWWPDVHIATVEEQPNRLAALEVERAAVAYERPRFNIVHALPALDENVLRLFDPTPVRPVTVLRPDRLLDDMNRAIHLLNPDQTT